MKLTIASLMIILLYLQCTVPKKYTIARNGIPFKNVELRLLQGRINDSIYSFSSLPEKSFIIKFDEKRFRTFDGSFLLKGTSKDTSSEYYTSVPYTGFYNLADSGIINLQWFRNISWSMDFNKHATGKTIAKLFFLKAKYDYNGRMLIFYKENITRDTIIVMEAL